ncbi:hypothetical protein Q9L58_008269 [Maublancomyces gigas]|uniref:Hydrophobin n=1 Tax=Discina gigas TaxID=1032678 RepID=A0ABR3GA60_9PEZI
MLTQNILTVLALAFAASALPTNNSPHYYSDGNSNNMGAAISATTPVPSQRHDSPSGSLPVSGSRPVPIPTQIYSPSNGGALNGGTLNGGTLNGGALNGGTLNGGLPVSTSSPVAVTRTSSTAATPPSQISSSGGDGRGNQNVGNSGQNAGSSVGNSGEIEGDYTVSQATTTCGNAQLNCCNKTVKKGDTTNAGLLGAVFGSGDIGVQCTPINIPVIGIQVPINKACDAKAACCQQKTSQSGLINIGCIALASLI